jgi:hypothetical protein
VAKPGTGTIVGVSNRTNSLEKSPGRVWCSGHIVDEAETEFSLLKSSSGSSEGKDYLDTHDPGQQSGDAIVLLDEIILNGRRIGAYGRVPVRRSASS